MALLDWLRRRRSFGPSPYPEHNDRLPLERECEPRPTPLRLLETHGGVSVEVHARQGCVRCQERLRELGD